MNSTERRVKKSAKGVKKTEGELLREEYEELRNTWRMMEAVVKFIKKKEGDLGNAKKFQKRKIENTIKGAREVYKLLHEFYYMTEKSIAHRRRIMKYVKRGRKRFGIEVEEEKKEVVREEKTEKETEESQGS